MKISIDTDKNEVEILSSSISFGELKCIIENVFGKDAEEVHILYSKGNTGIDSMYKEGLFKNVKRINGKLIEV